MKSQPFFLLIIIPLTMLSSCQGELPLPPLPSPRMIQIGITGDIQASIKDVLQDCLDSSPDLSPELLRVVEPYPDPAEYDLLIWQGDPSLYPELQNQAIISNGLTGYDLVLIISAQNQLKSLPLSTLRAIFSGKIQDWSSLPDSGLTGQIHLWVYYENHPLRLVFENALLGNLPISSSAFISPSQKEVIKAVKNSQTGIGFISQSAGVQNLNVLPISGISSPPVVSILAVYQKDSSAFASPVTECLLTTMPE